MEAGYYLYSERISLRIRIKSEIVLGPPHRTWAGCGSGESWGSSFERTASAVYGLYGLHRACSV